MTVNIDQDWSYMIGVMMMNVTMMRRTRRVSIDDDGKCQFAKKELPNLRRINEYFHECWWLNTTM